TDFLAQYPDVEELNGDDEDDLFLLMDDPSALPAPLAGGELFYTVSESRPKYAPGFPPKEKRGFPPNSKDKDDDSGRRGQSPHPRPPTPGHSAPQL
ncbi:hypothetical protein HDU96_004700, partial [Phlyctochytrium bullatum]